MEKKSQIIWKFHNKVVSLRQISVIYDIVFNIIATMSNNQTGQKCSVFIYKYMKYNEEKIASFQQGKDRLQLLKLTPDDYSIVRYQVRLNRKVLKTDMLEYQCRKLFATYARNIVLQIKIYKLC